MPPSGTADGEVLVGSTTLNATTPFVVMTNRNGHTALMALLSPAPTPPCGTPKCAASKPYVVGTEHEPALALHTADLQAPTEHVVRMHTCQVVSHLLADTHVPPASASCAQSASTLHPVVAGCGASAGTDRSRPASDAPAPSPRASTPDSEGVLASSPPGGWSRSDLSMPSEHPASIASATASARRA